MAQGFSVGGGIPARRSLSRNNDAPDHGCGFMGKLAGFFGSIAGFVLGAGVSGHISTIVGEENFLEWGWRIPFFIALPLGYRRSLPHAMRWKRRQRFSSTWINWNGATAKGWDGPKVSSAKGARKHWRSLLSCIGLVRCHQRDLLHAAHRMPSYLSHKPALF